MRVSDLMSRPAIICHVHDDLSVPARLMWDHDCGVIVVVGDDGRHGLGVRMPRSWTDLWNPHCAGSGACNVAVVGRARRPKQGSRFRRAGARVQAMRDRSGRRSADDLVALASRGAW